MMQLFIYCDVKEIIFTLYKFINVITFMYHESIHTGVHLQILYF